MTKQKEIINIKIEGSEHDGRKKLSEEDKEHILHLRSNYGTSYQKLANIFQVSKKTIYNVINPQKLKEYKDKEDRSKYYDKEKNTAYKRKAIRKKEELFNKGKIGTDEEAN